MPNWIHISKHISATLDQNFSGLQSRAVAGGCINSSWHLFDIEHDFFVKLNDARRLGMFEAEFHGLQLLHKTGCIKVPKAICFGLAGQNAYLVTEFIDLCGRPDSRLLGEKLACLHQNSQTHFGWNRDNTIGTSPQINTFSDQWIDFWGKQRLGYQLQLAAENGYTGELQTLGEELLGCFAGLFDAYSPQPSLLHGDLWSGNVSATTNGSPVIYDPAVYYGDRETDLAMTELFGGFDSAFYEAYRQAWPLDRGYDSRKHLYNLYHLLNHLNLFGGHYLQQCLQSLRILLSELR